MERTHSLSPFGGQKRGKGEERCYCLVLCVNDARNSHGEGSEHPPHQLRCPAPGCSAPSCSLPHQERCPWLGSEELQNRWSNFTGT